MIYAVNIVETPEMVDPVLNLTAPLLRLPFDVPSISFLSISDGFSDMSATYFIASTVSWIYGLTISHRSDEVPRLSALMAIDTPRNSVFALTFGKAFIQDNSGSVMRLGYSWACEASDVKPPASLSRVILQEYPTTHKLTRQPLLDEETGRIIERSKQSILIVDTAMYLN